MSDEVSLEEPEPDTYCDWCGYGPLRVVGYCPECAEKHGRKGRVYGSASEQED
jgi:hypothetical protein